MIELKVTYFRKRAGFSLKMPKNPTSCMPANTYPSAIRINLQTLGTAAPTTGIGDVRDCSGK